MSDIETNCVNIQFSNCGKTLKQVKTSNTNKQRMVGKADRYVRCRCFYDMDLRWSRSKNSLWVRNERWTNITAVKHEVFFQKYWKITPHPQYLLQFFREINWSPWWMGCNMQILVIRNTDFEKRKTYEGNTLPLPGEKANLHMSVTPILCVA